MMERGSSRPSFAKKPLGRARAEQKLGGKAEAMPHQPNLVYGTSLSLLGQEVGSRTPSQEQEQWDGGTEGGKAGHQ